MTIDYDRWLEQPYQDECDKEEWIRCRTESLLEDDYDPNAFDNFCEAISEASPDEIETLQDYLEQREFEKLGRALWCIALEKMEAQAEAQAIKDYFKAGCPKR